MGAEIKTGKHVLKTKTSLSLKTDFVHRCRQLNVSVAQRLRDLVQQDIKREVKPIKSHGNPSGK